MSYINSIAKDGFSITPDADLSPNAYGIHVGGAGDVQLITAGGTTVTYSGLVAGTTLNVQASKVVAAGTTATLLVGHLPQVGMQ